MADIITTNNKDDLKMVRKQRALRMLQHADLKISELQLIDLYISKMDVFLPKDMDEEGKEKKKQSQRKVIFTGGELEEALGVKSSASLKKKDLLPRLAALTKAIDLYPEDNKKVHLFSLFDPNSIRGVLENGYWTIELECTDAALEYVFIPEGRAFLQYMRYNSASHNGKKPTKHGFFLYAYLENERFRHKENADGNKVWIVSIESLKKELGVEGMYDDYKEFNRTVLKPAQKELELRTDCRFTYKPAVKKDRKTISLEITLEPKVAIRYVPSPAHQISIAEHQEEGSTIDKLDIKQEIEIEKAIAYGEEQIAAIYNRDILNNEFEIDDVLKIMNVLEEVYPFPPKSEASKVLDADGNERFDREHQEKVEKIYKQREDALKAAYIKLKKRQSKKKVEELGPVDSPVSYIKGILPQNKKEKKDSPAALRKSKGGNNPRRTGDEAGIKPDTPVPQQISLEDLDSTYNPDEDDILKIDM